MGDFAPCNVLDFQSPFPLAVKPTGIFSWRAPIFLVIRMGPSIASPECACLMFLPFNVNGRGVLCSLRVEHSWKSSLTGFVFQLSAWHCRALSSYFASFWLRLACIGDPRRSLGILIVNLNVILAARLECVPESHRDPQKFSVPSSCQLPRVGIAGHSQCLCCCSTIPLA